MSTLSLCQQLSLAFAKEFAQLNTQIVPSEPICGAEPIYLPATDLRPSYIGYAHGFVRSLLHEVAHWCIASPERRQLIDYGYQYSARRSVAQQIEFERQEVRPQALEALFCRVLDIEFEASLDNLDLLTAAVSSSSSTDSAQSYDQGLKFKRDLAQQIARFDSASDPIPKRAQRWIEALNRLKRTGDSV